MKKIFLLAAILVLSAFRTSAQTTVNGDSSYVPGAWVGTQVPNSVTGTTQFSIAKLTGAGTAVIAATTDTTGMIGIVGSGAGTSGNATIVQMGQVACNFDGATTQNDYVINSAAVNGDCHDGGSTPPNVQSFGRVLSTNGAAGAYVIAVSGGGGGSSSGGGASLTADNTFTNNNRFKGIDPWADITAFGATAVLPNGWTQDTASCVSGSTTITMAHTFFQNGQGLTITGCGATQTMGPVTVVTGPRPILARSGTSPYQTSINGNAFPVLAPTGSSTYKVAIVGRDIFGGLTAASPAVTITNSPAVLGLTSLTVSTISLSGTTITVTTTGTQALAIGAEVHLSGSTNALFSGWFNTATVNNAGNSFTITADGVDSRILGSQSATGGVAAYYTGMYVDWTQTTGTASSAYYVCAQRPGDSSMHVIGETAPSLQDGSVYPDASFYDFGPTLMGNPTLPFYVTDAVCTSAATRNDPLTTTIVSGGGTTSVVVANLASQTVSGQEADFDDAPAILAAANSCSYNAPGTTGCSIYIPAVAAAGGRLGYVVNSYLKLPAGTSIKQSGQLFLYETLELQAPYNWEGEWEAQPSGQFPMQASANVQVHTANPGIFTKGANGSMARNLSVSSSGTNGGVLWVTDDPYNQTFSHMSLESNGAGAGDYCGHDMLVRSTTGGGNPIHFDHVSFTGGPNQVTDSSWCPLFYFPGINSNSGGPGATGANWFVDIDSVFVNRRGIQQDTHGGPSSRWKVNWMYRQGGITPLFTFFNSSGTVNQFLNLGFDEQDTETVSTVAFLGISGVSSWLPFLNFTHVFNGSAEAGGVPPALTGIAPSAIDDFEGGYNSLNKNAIATDQLGLHANLIQAYPETFALLPSCSANEGMMAEITDSTVGSIGGIAAGGGSFKVGVRCDGTNWIVRSSTMGFSCPETTAPTGIASVDILWCGSADHRLALINNNGTSSDVATLADFAAPPTIGTTPGLGTFTTLTASINLVVSAKETFTETTAPSGVASSDLIWGDSTAHTLKINPNNAGAQTLARFTVTPTNGDCVTWSGTAGLLGDSGSACGAGGGGMDTNMDNMANPTAMSQSLIPVAANTVAAGSNALPFTNIFLGTVANQAGSFNTANLTANRVMNIPDATSTPVRDCPAVTNKFMTAEAVATGICTQANISASSTMPFAYAADSGSSTVYVVALTPAVASYTTGLEVDFLPANANTTATPTLNVNGVGAATITKFGTAALVANDMITTQIAKVIYDGTGWELQNPSTLSNVITASSTNTFTNKTENVESTGNVFSEPVRAFFSAGGCNNSTPGNGWDIGVTNAPTPQCAGTTVRKGVLQFAHGNIAYLNWHLPTDWNSAAATDIEIGFTTTDTTNGHTTIWDIQTGCNKTDGTVTDDPTLNAQQQLTVTTGASQVSGGELVGLKTALTMTGCVADYNFEIAIKRDAADTNTDTAVAVKFAEVITGVTKNATNR